LGSRSRGWAAGLLFGILALAMDGCGTLAAALDESSLLAASPLPAPEVRSEDPIPVTPAATVAVDEAAPAAGSDPTGEATAAPGAVAIIIPAVVEPDVDVGADSPEGAGRVSIDLPALTLSFDDFTAEEDAASLLAAFAGPLLVAQRDASSGRDPAEVEEYDPWEPFNDTMFEFNRGLDRYVIKPVAKVYDFITPDELKQMISRGFDNIRVVPRVVNSLLQAKWAGAGREVARFLINSVVGIGGLWDMAKQEWGIEKSDEDFGQTLGVWGAGPGPYLVLPFFRPLTVRDGIGVAVDGFMDPLNYVLPFIWERLAMRIGDTINERALNLELFQGFEETTVDLYTAVRNGYLQRRQQQIRE
jgi:phospholipid-binding lipoprotein MlaA